MGAYRGYLSTLSEELTDRDAATVQIWGHMNQGGRAGGLVGQIQHPEVVDADSNIDKFSDVCCLIYKFESKILRTD